MTAVAETNGMDPNVSCSVVSANDRFQASRSNTQGPAVDPIPSFGDVVWLPQSGYQRPHPVSGLLEPYAPYGRAQWPHRFGLERAVRGPIRHHAPRRRRGLVITSN